MSSLLSFALVAAFSVTDGLITGASEALDSSLPINMDIDQKIEVRVINTVLNCCPLQRYYYEMHYLPNRNWASLLYSVHERTF